MGTDPTAPTAPTEADRVNRRRLLVFATASAAAAAVGCRRESSPPVAADPDGGTGPAARGTPNANALLPEGVFDAGPLADYQQQGPDDSLRDDGFFVIRNGDEVCALSAVCTHRGCLVNAQPDASFKCFCHGSRFSPEGVVQNGPATEDLPRLAVRVDLRGHLLVDKTQRVSIPHNEWSMPEENEHA
ncbi:QcrA and Rieske domain-containing protein [Phycisphaera mikurensis]|uniref:Putative iron-sulfur protein n=1 Tax=Phycisphaera mikurensis (strain NBRC 102666 / KCTC 22515 / FYK2301M01) TaxID=1142394 RepID=I0IJF6_PHYMF|nr:Rieske (2Fe-2S) protein [Phycisphaera mikurensis]MBB6443144.1 Rieske Fe-S protein [Phycisphaera mikurensis]BAM05394.1 putative iron-sulfur protein [Phycisphaera mikurensis NBRC 102666]